MTVDLTYLLPTRDKILIYYYKFSGVRHVFCFLSFKGLMGEGVLFFQYKYPRSIKQYRHPLLAADSKTDN